MTQSFRHCEARSTVAIHTCDNKKVSLKINETTFFIDKKRYEIMGIVAPHNNEKKGLQ
jgi:hypothetical protein